MALAVGDILENKYEITRVLGEGGMGTVFAAEHKKLRRRVAVKAMKASLAANPDLVERFELEATAAGHIGSQHIAEIYDVGTRPSGERYMIMEYLEGESLAARLSARGRMTPEELFPIAVQLLDGLAAAHEAGIVHRDLKPANIFLVSDRRGYQDFVKILDFGVSKFSLIGSGEGVTRTGEIVGTPNYMSPELTKGSRNADHRSDQYSVAAILYRAMSGRHPVSGETIHELLVQLMTVTPPSLVSLVPEIDMAAAAIVHRALSRDPKDRFAATEDFMRAVADWLFDRSIVIRAPDSSGNYSMPSARRSLASTPGVSDPASRPPAAAALPRTATPTATTSVDGLERTTERVDSPKSSVTETAVVQTPTAERELQTLSTPAPSLIDSDAQLSAPSTRVWAVVLPSALVVSALVGGLIYSTVASSERPDPAGLDASASPAASLKRDVSPSSANAPLPTDSPSLETASPAASPPSATASASTQPSAKPKSPPSAKPRRQPSWRPTPRIIREDLP